MMDKLVEVMSKLRKVLDAAGLETIELPRIVVFGRKAVGKTSVLQALLGREWYPRGPTKAPVVIKFVQATEPTAANGKAGFWAQFSHCSDKVFTNLKSVVDEIDRRSRTVVSSVPVILRVHSQKVPNITVVDIPGYPDGYPGKSDLEVEEAKAEIKSILCDYISCPSLLLAVVGAGDDLVQNFTLEIVKQLDPKCENTIVIVTRLDRLDEYKDLNYIMDQIGSNFNVIGVVNRTDDMKDEKPLEEAVFDETSFLHAHFPTIAGDHGMFRLTAVVESVMMDRIHWVLPNIRSKIQDIYQHYQYLVRSYGDPVARSKDFLLHLITRFAGAYTAKVQGNHKQLQTKELDGGARINFIFNEIFANALNAINPLESMSKGGILTAIKNSCGTRPVLFVPDNAFDLLVKKQLQKLEAPCFRCVQLVHEEMERVCYNCGESINMELNRFPKLRVRLVSVVQDLIKRKLPSVNDMVEKLLHIQYAYINTSHPEFSAAINQLLISVEKNKADTLKKPTSKSGSQNGPSPSQSSVVSISSEDVSLSEVHMIEVLINKYFEVVKRNVQDNVPKAIMYFLVNDVVDSLLSELVAHLYATENCEELLDESTLVQNQRVQACTALQTLERAERLLLEIKDELTVH